MRIEACHVAQPVGFIPMDGSVLHTDCEPTTRTHVHRLAYMQCEGFVQCLLIFAVNAAQTLANEACNLVKYAPQGIRTLP